MSVLIIVVNIIPKNIIKLDIDKINLFLLKFLFRASNSNSDFGAEFEFRFWHKILTTSRYMADIVW